jgi:hypothetical protein
VWNSTVIRVHSTAWKRCISKVDGLVQMSMNAGIITGPEGKDRRSEGETDGGSWKERRREMLKPTDDDVCFAHQLPVDIL